MQKHYAIAEVHGMCGGVFAALDKLEKMLARHPGETVYVLHELVHNNAVTGDFERRGVRFVDQISEIPPGKPAVIGAHGVSAEMERDIRRVAGEVVDATCPLVRKLHDTVHKLTAADQLIIFGKKDHPEVAGVAGNSGAGQNFIVFSPEDIVQLPELDSPFFISQTTVDAARCDAARKLLLKRFPHLRCASGVCDASKKRQAAVIRLARCCQAVIVAGSPHSSNACRLREIAEQNGAEAILVDNAGELPMELLQKYHSIGVTSGASTPEYILKKIISKLEENLFTP